MHTNSEIWGAQAASLLVSAASRNELRFQQACSLQKLNRTTSPIQTRQSSKPQIFSPSTGPVKVSAKTGFIQRFDVP
jgi:hypothetical protein